MEINLNDSDCLETSCFVNDIIKRYLDKVGVRK